MNTLYSQELISLKQQVECVGSFTRHCELGFLEKIMSQKTGSVQWDDILASHYLDNGRGKTDTIMASWFVIKTASYDGQLLVLRC